MIIFQFASAIILGYLIGSIPFGFIIGKKFAGIDVRDFGSGKMGTTNVLRTAGRKAAILVAVLDIIKGVLAVVFAGLIIGSSFIVINNFSLGTAVCQVCAGLASVAGHNWPVFLKFRGGRGVATFFGGLAALYPPAALIGGEVLILSVGLTRFVSFGSIAGVVATYAVLVPIALLNGNGWFYVVLAYSLAGAIIIIIMHRDNIVRLFKGNERKLGEKAENQEFPRT